MLTARSAFKRALLAVPLILAALVIASQTTWAAAGGLQICQPSTTCEVGEFLYDDNYSPITSGATCTLTARDTSGNLLYNSVSMTGQSDGWYSYEFTAPSTEGMYRTQVCCVVSGETICIDKSFEINEDASGPSTGDIANAVWSHSDRTLTSLGTLVRDIWLHSTRTLTSLNTTSTTTTTTTTTTGTGTGTEGDDLAEIKKTVKENRLLLEGLVNEPIIETYLEDDGETPDLSVKLEQTRTFTNQLYADTQYLRSKSGVLADKWNLMGEEEVVSSISDLMGVLGDQTDSKDQQTFFGSLAWINYSWGWSESDTLKNEASEVASVLKSAQIDIASRGMSAEAFRNVKSIAEHLDKMEALIGDSSNNVTDKTLFGELKSVNELATLLTKQEDQVMALLTSWSSKSDLTRKSDLNTIVKGVVPLNRMPKLLTSLKYDQSDEKQLRNNVLAMGGVIKANKDLLAKPHGKAVATTWLELGSIVFKSVITNPSTLITQTAKLKFYLPQEVKEEDILKVDDGLAVDYDTDQDRYYVHGHIELKPGEVVTKAVQIENIWIITDQEMQAIQNEAEELLKPLEGTSFYAQGVTLKSDIEASLAKISMLQSGAITPEQQIKAYRESMVEMASVTDKLEKLRDIVTQAGSHDSLKAFVGGSQTLSMWGLIIIILGGFAFMAIYMRNFRKNEVAAEAKESKSKHDKPRHHSPPPSYDVGRYVKTALAMLVFGAVVSAGTGFTVVKYMSHNDTSQTQVLGDESSEPVETARGGEPVVIIIGDLVTVRRGPSSTSSVVENVPGGVEAVKIGEAGDWVKLIFKEGDYALEPITGWVLAGSTIEGNN